MKTLEFPKELFNQKFAEYLFDTKSSIEILFGGAGSSKTVHSAFKDILRVLQGKNVLVIRQVYNTLEDSYFQDLKKAISILGVEPLFEIKRSPLKISCANKKVILFRGLDDVEKIKGITVPDGQIDHFTVEEATETREDSINQLQFRSRGGGSKLDLHELEYIKEVFDNADSLEELQSQETKEDIFQTLGFDSREDFVQSEKTMTMLFNPVNKSHWIYERFFKDSKGKPIFRIGDKPYNTQELYIMHSTHWDNEFLTIDDHRRYEAYRFISKYFYDVYACGKWGVLGDLIFTKVKPANFSSDFARKRDDIKWFVGLDFGVKPDPNAIIRTGISEARKEIYVIDEFCRGKLTSDQLATYVKSFLWYDKEAVYCDSAGSQQIHDLQTKGVNAVPVSKYGRVAGEFKSHGIGVLWGYTIYVSQDCKTFAGEISEYCWEKDSKGNHTGRPEDGNDHCIDAGLFYALNSILIRHKRTVVHGGN